jgi:hypothetical protein
MRRGKRLAESACTRFGALSYFQFNFNAQEYFGTRGGGVRTWNATSAKYVFNGMERETKNLLRKMLR